MRAHDVHPLSKALADALGDGWRAIPTPAQSSDVCVRLHTPDGRATLVDVRRVRGGRWWLTANGPRSITTPRARTHAKVAAAVAAEVRASLAANPKRWPSGATYDGTTYNEIAGSAAGPASHRTLGRSPSGGADREP